MLALIVSVIFLFVNNITKKIKKYTTKKTDEISSVLKIICSSNP